LKDATPSVAENVDAFFPFLTACPPFFFPSRDSEIAVLPLHKRHAIELPLNESGVILFFILSLLSSAARVFPPRDVIVPFLFSPALSRLGAEFLPFGKKVDFSPMHKVRWRSPFFVFSRASSPSPQRSAFLSEEEQEVPLLLEKKRELFSFFSLPTLSPPSGQSAPFLKKGFTGPSPSKSGLHHCSPSLSPADASRLKAFFIRTEIPLGPSFEFEPLFFHWTRAGLPAQPANDLSFFCFPFIVFSSGVIFLFASQGQTTNPHQPSSPPPPPPPPPPPIFSYSPFFFC